MNRNILEEAMVEAGFLPFSTEWWHFDDPEWEKYPILDLSFESLEK
jgi:D-alanyl-D-alanine dipeptidase